MKLLVCLESIWALVVLGDCASVAMLVFIDIKLDRQRGKENERERKLLSVFICDLARVNWDIGWAFPFVKV